jgi:NAD(P)-dependent dehydrogenase (short-subunit alcohol dehydrogenase family)
MGYHVIVHGRNQEKGEIALKKIKKELNYEQVSIVYADFESFSQIKDMVSDIYNRFESIDVLINNAGVYRTQRNVTQEGLEETFSVNYVAPFLLTNLLINLLKKGTSSRIVNVSTQIHSNKIRFNDLQLENNYSGYKAYSQSKAAIILFTYLLADYLKDLRISVNCLHPGVINTKLLRSAFGSGGGPPTIGAKTLIYAATAPELENTTAKYLVNNQPTTSNKITYDREIQKRLWKKTEEILGIKFNNF